MSRIYYYDTSGLIKLYHQEIGTEWVERIFNDKNTIIISELSTVEFYSTLAKKVRTKEVTRDAKEVALKNFLKDCKERFILNPINAASIKKAKEIIERYGDTKSIKTLDALQLAACILESEEIVFVCSDAKLIEISELEGVEGINPETKDYDLSKVKKQEKE